MKHTAGMVVALVGLWVLWSWHFTPLLLALGAASILFALFLSRRMGIVDEEGAPVGLPPRLLVYLPWLFLEIIKSNLDVARRILSPGLPIDPRVIKVRASQTGDLGRVIYANSITLTPGTVSIGVDDDEITVHALTAEAAAGLETGEMDGRVKRLEGG